MITAIIKPRIEEIFELINRRLNRYKSITKSVDKIILCGGGANLNNIREF